MRERHEGFFASWERGLRDNARTKGDSFLLLCNASEICEETTMFGISGSDLIVFIGLVLIGIIVLTRIRAVIHFVIHLAGAIVVWLYTGSLTSAGITFAVIALLELAFRKL